MPAFAQSDTSGLVDRLDRLERDLTGVQKQLYRGQSGGASAGGATAGANLSGDAYGRLDDRLSALEAQLRELTGALEKATFTDAQLTSKLDRMQADNDLRFRALETKTGLAPAMAPANGNAPSSDPAVPAAAAGATGGVLTHPSGAGSAAVAAAPAAAHKTPKEQYDLAYDLLKKADYAASAKAFQVFVAQNPQDSLAGNAVYWQGQISYMQGQFDQAAISFMEAYRKYPKSVHAGESLLKVGLSMSSLGKKKEACAALHRFGTEFPDAADNLKRQGSAEKQKLGC
ncbi:MAG TPA: tol-pal system protein YbgF [Rhodospirillaceae bacterium]|nr:tol-pal system protein YbgF [Rhodospirillaceae bacterium]